MKLTKKKSFSCLVTIECILASILAGCIPVSSLYYEPEAGLGAVSSEGPCSMNIEREITLSLSDNIELRLQIQLDRSQQEPTRVHVRYSIPAGLIVKLSRDFVEIRADEESRFFYKLKTINVVSVPGPPYQIMVTDTIEGKVWMDRDGVVGRTYFNFIVPLQHRPSVLSIVSPGLASDGKIVEIPKVVFTRKKRTHVTGLCQ